MIETISVNNKCQNAANDIHQWRFSPLVHMLIQYFCARSCIFLRPINLFCCIHLKCYLYDIFGTASVVFSTRQAAGWELASYISHWISRRKNWCCCNGQKTFWNHFKECSRIDSPWPEVKLVSHAGGTYIFNILSVNTLLPLLSTAQICKESWVYVLRAE